MLSRTVKVELSEEARAALAALDADVQVLAELLHELTETHGRILEVLTADVAEPELIDRGAPGVRVFENEPVEPREPDPPPPAAMQTQTMFDTRDLNGDRMRETPFTRAPRAVQVEWLVRVMADGEWHSAISIARRHATDERHFRYMRGAVGGRLREMYEDRKVARRDSEVRGAMYEYRLVGDE